VQSIVLKVTRGYLEFCKGGDGKSKCRSHRGETPNGMSKGWGVGRGCPLPQNFGFSLKMLHFVHFMRFRTKFKSVTVITK